jgi:hypothetical protein
MHRKKYLFVPCWTGDWPLPRLSAGHISIHSDMKYRLYLTSECKHNFKEEASGTGHDTRTNFGQ